MSAIVPLFAILAMTTATHQPKLNDLRPLPAFPPPGDSATVELPEVDPGFAWNEAIASWNVQNPGASTIRIDVCGIRRTGRTKWYCLGEWCADDRDSPRRSVVKQKDSDGDVLTDTLRLSVPGERLGVKLTMTGGSVGDRPQLKLLTVTFSDRSSPYEETDGDRSAWGKTIDVFQRSQMPYEYGKLILDPASVAPSFREWYGKVKTAQFCSPTSLSMVMNYWADRLRRGELNQDLPQVAQGVFDRDYPGTGNWPFNTAYAGSWPGIRAYVARLSSVGELERWIGRGYPVICSVSYHLLMGRPSGGSDGHLVTLVGFSPAGDPVFNDPGRSDHVRQTYKRVDFERAWDDSGRTVYMVYPEDAAVPDDPLGQWVATGSSGQT